MNQAMAQVASSGQHGRDQRFSSRRGRAGALSTLPGRGCSSGAAPNGSAMKKISHHTVTK